MKAQSTMKSRLQAFSVFCWWGMCVQPQDLRKQRTVTTGNILVGGEGTSLPQSHISLLHLKLQLLWPWLQQHSTSTTVKQHSHADLNVCINPPPRSPAQTHVLQLDCLPCLHFHSQIPKTYTEFNPKPTALHLTSFRDKEHHDSLGI